MVLPVRALTTDNLWDVTGGIQSDCFTSESLHKDLHTTAIVFRKICIPPRRQRATHTADNLWDVTGGIQSDCFTSESLHKDLHTTAIVFRKICIPPQRQRATHTT